MIDGNDRDIIDDDNLEKVAKESFDEAIVDMAEDIKGTGRSQSEEMAIKEISKIVLNEAIKAMNKQPMTVINPDKHLLDEFARNAPPLEFALEPHEVQRLMELLNGEALPSGTISERSDEEFVQLIKNAYKFRSKLNYMYAEQMLIERKNHDS